MNRPPALRPTKNQTSWAVLVVRVRLDDLTRLYRFLGFRVQNQAPLHLVDGMSGILENATRELLANLFNHNPAS
jgi:hypothetical protein